MNVRDVEGTGSRSLIAPRCVRLQWGRLLFFGAAGSRGHRLCCRFRRRGSYALLAILLLPTELLKRLNLAEEHLGRRFLRGEGVAVEMSVDVPGQRAELLHYLFHNLTIEADTFEAIKAHALLEALYHLVEQVVNNECLV